MRAFGMPGTLSTASTTRLGGLPQEPMQKHRHGRKEHLSQSFSRENSGTKSARLWLVSTLANGFFE